MWSSQVRALFAPRAIRRSRSVPSGGRSAGTTASRRPCRRGCQPLAAPGPGRRARRRRIPTTRARSCSPAPSGDPTVRAELERVADVVVCGDRASISPAARAALSERGLTRILCEGGPTLFADLAHAGVVDELCLSISPLLSGPVPGASSPGELWTGDPPGTHPRPACSKRTAHCSAATASFA